MAESFGLGDPLEGAPTTPGPGEDDVVFAELIEDPLSDPVGDPLTDPLAVVLSQPTVDHFDRRSAKRREREVREAAKRASREDAERRKAARRAAKLEAHQPAPLAVEAEGREEVELPGAAAPKPSRPGRKRAVSRAVVPVRQPAAVVVEEAAKPSAEQRKAARQASRELKRQARVERQFRRKARRLGIEVEDAPPSTGDAIAALPRSTAPVSWQLPPGVAVPPDRELAHVAMGLPEPIPSRKELPLGD